MNDEQGTRVDASGWTYVGTLGELAAERGVELPPGNFFGPILCPKVWGGTTSWVATGEPEADAPVTVETR